MSDALAIAPAAPAAPTAPSFDDLAALIPDTAIRSDASPSVGTSAAPAPAENTADAADSARLNPPEGEQPPAEEPAPTEGEQPPAEEPAAEQVDLEALERAEQAAKRAREGSRRYREMLAEQDRQRQEVQRAAREAEALRREAEEARRLRESLTKDPYKALKNLGMTDQDLAERALREGTPEAEIFAVKERLEQERQAREALEQRLAAREAEIARREVEANFARVADNEDAFPRLAQLSTDAQLAVAREALKKIAANGYEVRGFTDEQVAEAAERYLAPKRAPKSSGAPAPAKTTPAPAAKPAAKASSATLTNAVATQKAVASRPWHDLTDDEQIAQIAAMLPD